MNQIKTGIKCPFCNGELVVREIGEDGISYPTTMELIMNEDFSIDNPWLPEYEDYGADVGLEADCTNEGCIFWEVAEVSHDNFVCYRDPHSGQLYSFIKGEWVEIDDEDY
ncbi:MAG TPA: hypothetical protein PLZ08_04615 [Bacillota bacterium]|jgi:hypothetical protein|nr:hypothetical protein [Bacillota bacterium]HOL10744.1 hypothetical protein [Bacillota bacterium]HPO97225.1 hypothetical protein [Bacillota bacterium]